MEYSPFIIMDTRNLNNRSKDRNELLLSFCKKCMSLEQSKNCNGELFFATIRLTELKN